MTDNSKSFDRVADKFDETRKYPDDIMTTIVRALEQELSVDGRTLDAGVGTGRFAKPLQEMGFSVIGVDLSKRMLGKAAQKGTADLVRADMCCLPFADDSFEDAISVHVMHLISDWEGALQEIARVTTGRMLSVVFSKEDSEVEDLRRFYADTCEELGYPLIDLGLREIELTEVLEPDTSREIARHIHPVHAGVMIENYQTRTFSDQWDVPDDVHEQAMEAMRERYDGVDQLMGRERISLVGWQADRLGSIPDE